MCILVFAIVHKHIPYHTLKQAMVEFQHPALESECLHDYCHLTYQFGKILTFSMYICYTYKPTCIFIYLCIWTFLPFPIDCTTANIITLTEIASPSVYGKWQIIFICTCFFTFLFHSTMLVRFPFDLPPATHTYLNAIKGI